MVEMTAKKVEICIGSFYTVLNKNLNMHCICQHITPRMLMHEQCNNHISTACNNPEFSLQNHHRSRYVFVQSPNWTTIHVEVAERHNVLVGSLRREGSESLFSPGHPLFTMSLHSARRWCICGRWFALVSHNAGGQSLYAPAWQCPGTSVACYLMLSHPSYSPDLAPYNFYFFPQMDSKRAVTSRIQWRLKWFQRLNFRRQYIVAFMNVLNNCKIPGRNV